MAQSNYKPNVDPDQMEREGELLIPERYLKIGGGIIIAIVLYIFIGRVIRNQQVNRYNKDALRRSEDEMFTKRKKQ